MYGDGTWKHINSRKYIYGKWVHYTVTSLLTTVLVTVAARDTRYICIYCTVTSLLTTVFVTVAARDTRYTCIYCTVTSLLKTVFVTVAARDTRYTCIYCTVTSLLPTVLVTVAARDTRFSNNHYSVLRRTTIRRSTYIFKHSPCIKHGTLLILLIMIPLEILRTFIPTVSFFSKITVTA